MLSMASRFTIIVIFAAALCYFPSLGVFVDQQVYLGGAVPFELRDAVIADVDDITTVFMDAFSQAPVWSYIHQFEDQYPGYNWGCVREQVVQGLTEPPNVTDDALFRVISVPDGTSQSGTRVVSVSMWQFGKPNATGWPLGLNGSASCSLHLGTNMTRALDLSKRMDNAHKTYLEDVYERQLYLAVLATHPKWDGNGFAAAHLHWGMAIADNMGMPLTLMATTAGYPLYKSVGFGDIYNLTIERLDGLGTIWYEVQKYSA
ncbi:hypothetical protein BJ170DRAFT_290280 [Xylariales sp. AK1849]|nr:hypothetical protein BJ170DRAFT_290280 [Xylariales sp. AK1849]